MSFIQAYVKTNLQVLAEILPSVKRECGGCLPSALTFEESVQRFPEFRHKRNFVVSLLPCDHVESFHQEVLLDVWVLKQLQESEARNAIVEENKFHEEENTLTLYLTHELKDYQDLDLNKERCYLLRDVTPIPLQRITIGALSIESFEWAKEHLKEFLIKSINKHLVIIKQNGNFGEMFIQSDLYQMLSMLMILECVPVMQGVVTADTMLVVSDIHRGDLDKWHLKRLKSMQGSGKVPHLPLLKMPGTKPAKLTYATIALDEPDSGISSLKEELLNTLLVSLLDVPFYCQNLPNFDHIVDVDNKIWITRATMSAMQLNMGSWVRVSVSPMKHGISFVEDLTHESEASVIISQSNASQEEKPSKIKLAQVFPIEERRRMDCVWQDQNSMIVHSSAEEFENGTAYISPVFFFNIIPSPSNDVKSVILSIERAELRESPPCFATEVSISVIASPLTKITSMYDNIFAQHFSKPRLVSPEDILCVYCDWKNLEVTNSQAALDEGLPRNHMMYFKVKKLTGIDEESLSYFVDGKYSKLFQTNNAEKSCVPVMAELFVRNSVDVEHKESSYWLTTHPGGLNVHVSKLENVLRSLLINHKTTDVFPVLVSGTAGVGKKTVIMAASRRLHLQVVDVNCYEISGDTTAATEARLRNSCAKAFDCAPCILLLSNVHCLGKNKDANDKEPRIVTTLLVNLEEIQKMSPHPVLVLGTTSQPQSMTMDLRSCFLDEVEIEPPTEKQRIEMLQALSAGFLIGPGVSFEALASRTAGMVLADFCTLFSEAVMQAQEGVISYCKGWGLVDEIPNPSEDRLSAGEEKNQFHKYINLQKDICSAGILLHQCHFDQAIHILQAAHSDSIGAPKIPNVSWQDIGGLSNVKQEILDTIQLPFQYPEVFAAGLQRSGILLYGPPGTGKTLVAKAVATECSLNFLSVKGPELINMYVGQSEENVREIFATAARAAPCVIFFDELDSLAPNRGRSGDSGGVMDRVVSQLLSELDGIQKSRDVFVIGATNRPDLLDPALLRPGRFDTLLYLGISEDKEDRMKIMKALTRKFHLSNELSLEEVVDKCPANLTGADFYALCSNALLNAIRRQIQEENMGSDKAELIQNDFELAIEKLVPSVSAKELTRYERIRWEFTKGKQAHKEIEEELELDGKVIRALTLE